MCVCCNMILTKLISYTYAPNGFLFFYTFKRHYTTKTKVAVKYLPLDLINKKSIIFYVRLFVLIERKKGILNNMIFEDVLLSILFLNRKYSILWNSFEKKKHFFFTRMRKENG